MADTTYTNGVTLTDADWFNDVNRLHYTILGDPADAAAIVTALGISTSVDVKVNDFRLTLTTGVPVTTSDVNAATSIYLCPYKGNKITLYDGAAWGTIESTEVSLSIAGLTTTLPHDVFAYNNTGTVTLEALPWTNTTTRATALAYQDGVLVKSGAATRRYLGTFFTSATGETDDSISKRYLENYYNQVDRPLWGTYSTARTRASATYGEMNSEIQFKFVVGVSENPIQFSAVGSAYNASGNYGCNIGIGINSTSAATAGLECGTLLAIISSGTYTGQIAINNAVYAAVGYSYATLISATAGGTLTFPSASVVGTSGAVSKVYLNAIKKG